MTWGSQPVVPPSETQNRIQVNPNFQWEIPKINMPFSTVHKMSLPWQATFLLFFFPEDWIILLKCILFLNVSYVSGTWISTLCLLSKTSICKTSTAAVPSQVRNEGWEKLACLWSASYWVTQTNCDRCCLPPVPERSGQHSLVEASLLKVVLAPDQDNTALWASAPWHDRQVIENDWNRIVREHHMH